MADHRRTAAPPRFYFSFRSPYSWLAYRDIRDQHEDVASALEWIPFWEPDERTHRLLLQAGGRFVYTPMSREKHLYILQDIRRLAAQRGLSMTWPLDRQPSWEVPHLAYLVAAEEGCGPEFTARVYRARWQEGRDVCDRATIAAVAADLGLDPTRLAHVVDDPVVRDRGAAALCAAYRDGVFGVPFFVHGFDKYWGVDRLPTFVARLGERRVTLPGRESCSGALGPSSDWGHAGGCG